MPRLGGGKPPTETMIVILIITIAGLYLWGYFTNPLTDKCTDADVTNKLYGCEDGQAGVTIRSGFDFVIPDDMDTPTLWVMRFIIVGTALFVGVAVAKKFTGGSIGRRDVFTLVLLGIIAVVLYQYIFKNILVAHSFNDIVFKAAKTFKLI